jgi:hypothetical protein
MKYLAALLLALVLWKNSFAQYVIQPHPVSGHPWAYPAWQYPRVAPQHYYYLQPSQHYYYVQPRVEVQVNYNYQYPVIINQPIFNNVYYPGVR